MAEPVHQYVITLWRCVTGAPHPGHDHVRLESTQTTAIHPGVVKIEFTAKAKALCFHALATQGVQAVSMAANKRALVNLTRRLKRNTQTHKEVFSTAVLGTGEYLRDTQFIAHDCCSLLGGATRSSTPL